MGSGGSVGLTAPGMGGAAEQLPESRGSEREECYPKRLFPDVCISASDHSQSVTHTEIT